VKEVLDLDGSKVREKVFELALRIGLTI